ncbi:hypothetical protein [Prosthecobacter fluviatilis]|uniref:Uncharacterized protein n=1 Tax=Prosthecobacter fluviatilis TaxID=445931 RepID=A0ABW0KN52_9BACT
MPELWWAFFDRAVIEFLLTAGVRRWFGTSKIKNRLLDNRQSSGSEGVVAMRD